MIGRPGIAGSGSRTRRAHILRLLGLAPRRKDAAVPPAATYRPTAASRGFYPGAPRHHARLFARLTSPEGIAERFPGGAWQFMAAVRDRNKMLAATMGPLPVRRAKE